MLKRRSLIAAVTAAMMACPVVAQADRAESSGVSPMMAEAIQDFVVASLRRDAEDMEANPSNYASVSKARAEALKALAFHAPANLIEHAAKLSALAEFTDDSERFALLMAAQDAFKLAGGR